MVGLGRFGGRRPATPSEGPPADLTRISGRHTTEASRSEGPDDTGGFVVPGYVDPVEVGRGGFGIVYRARDLDHDRDVAIKVLYSASLDAAGRSRFDLERAALGRLGTHPHIVTVYATGYTEHGHPYIVMEYAPGGSVRSLVDRSGPRPWTEAISRSIDLCGAVETAHRAGILHRDIKPDNVLLSAYDDAKLCDFGIAAAFGNGASATATQIGMSIAHSGPEVIDGKKQTVRSDVYALASTVFTEILGHPPFRRDDDTSVVAMLNRIVNEPTPDLRRLGVPDVVCAVLERALAKDPSVRFDSVEDMGEALRSAAVSTGAEMSKMRIGSVSGADDDQAVLDGRTVISSSHRPDQLAGPAADERELDVVADLIDLGTASSTASTHRGQRRTIVLAAVGVCLLLAGAVGAIWQFTKDATDSKDEPEVAGLTIEAGEDESGVVAGAADESSDQTTTSASTPTTAASNTSASTPTTTAASTTGAPEPSVTGAAIAPTTTRAPTTPPSTTGPSTTRPSTTRPSTTRPSTTRPSNTLASTTLASNTLASTTAGPATTAAPATPAPAPTPPPATTAVPLPSASIGGGSQLVIGEEFFWSVSSQNAVSGTWSSNCGVQNSSWSPGNGWGGSYGGSARNCTLTLTVFNSAGQSTSTTKSFSLVEG